MDQSQHTPAKWRLGSNKRVICNSTLTAVICTIADNKQYNTLLSAEEKDANAHLISAAPELLEALEDIMAIVPVEALDVPLYAKARAAIAKAKGLGT